MICVSSVCVCISELIECFNITKHAAITSQPSDRAVLLGDDIELSVTVSGPVGGYQWFGPGGVALTDGARIADSNPEGVLIFGALLSDAGEYFVRVTGLAAGATVDSDTATVAVYCEFHFLSDRYT